MTQFADLENRILEALKQVPTGQKITDLAQALHLDVGSDSIRRALQRALKSLEKKNKITHQGEARARKYFPTRTVGVITPVLSLVISEEGQKLLEYVSQPSSQRTPVGYNRDFLRQYIPNKTSYLSDEQKNYLEKLGRVDITNQPAGTYARDIYSRLLIDLSWNSSRLEGNTYSLLETKRLLEFGQEAAGKDVAEAQMILNHRSAIEFLIESASEIDFNSYTICNIHALLSDNLLGDSSASGKLRDRPVEISGSAYLPIDNPHFLKEMFDLFLQKAKEIENPFEQSLFALIHLSYLQAFEDVNKRTSRIAANIPLIVKNVRPLAFVEVDRDLYLKALLGIYEKNDISLFRDLFLWAYRRSTQKYSALQLSMGEPNAFKLKHRAHIQDIVHTIVKSKIPGPSIPGALLKFVNDLRLSPDDSRKMSQILEDEITSLHEGNIVRYKLRPSEYKEWLALQ